MGRLGRRQARFGSQGANPLWRLVDQHSQLWKGLAFVAVGESTAAARRLEEASATDEEAFLLRQLIVYQPEPELHAA